MPINNEPTLVSKSLSLLYDFALFLNDCTTCFGELNIFFQNLWNIAPYAGHWCSSWCLPHFRHLSSTGFMNLLNLLFVCILVMIWPHRQNNCIQRRLLASPIYVFCRAKQRLEGPVHIFWILLDNFSSTWSYLVIYWILVKIKHRRRGIKSLLRGLLTDRDKYRNLGS